MASLPRARLPQAVILMSDSRWTYSKPGLKHEDIGTKVFALDNSTAITFSGDVRAGEHCITELGNKLRNRNVRYININKTFQRIYRYHRKRDPETSRLMLLMGKYLRSGETRLVYFESPKFEHVFVEGIKGIGDELAFRELFKKVGPQIDDLSIYMGKTQDDTMKIAMLLAGVLNDEIIPNIRYKTVGGPIQFVIVARGGVHTSELSWTRDPRGITDTWHLATARDDELTTYRKRRKLSPNFIDLEALCFCSYCD